MANHGKPANSNRPLRRQTTAALMKAARIAWDAAPEGPKKDASLKHYQAAEKAHTAKNDAETIKEIKAATLALA